MALHLIGGKPGNILPQTPQKILFVSCILLYALYYSVSNEQSNLKKKHFLLK